MVKPKIVQKYMKVEQKLNLESIYTYTWVLFCDTPFCNIPVAVVEMKYVEIKHSDPCCTYSIYPALIIYPGKDNEIPYNSAYMISTPIIKDLNIVSEYFSDYNTFLELTLNMTGPSSINGKTSFTIEQCLKIMAENLNCLRINMFRNAGYFNKDYFSFSIIHRADSHINSLIYYEFTSEIDKDQRRFISYDDVRIGSKLEYKNLFFKYKDIRDLYETRNSTDGLILKSYAGEGEDIPVKIV